MYSSTLSLTSALGGCGWLTPLPGRLTPGKEAENPLYKRLGGPQVRSGRVRKISPPPEYCRGVQTFFFLRKVIIFNVNRFGGRKCKNHNKLHTQSPELLCDFLWCEYNLRTCLWLFNDPLTFPNLSFLDS